MQRVSFLSDALDEAAGFETAYGYPCRSLPYAKMSGKLVLSGCAKLAQGEEHLWLTGVKAVFAQKQLHTDIIGVLKGEEGLAKVSGKFFARY